MRRFETSSPLSSGRIWVDDRRVLSGIIDVVRDRLMACGAHPVYGFCGTHRDSLHLWERFTMTTQVWVSDAMLHPAHLRPITHAFEQSRVDFATDCARQNNQGLPLPSPCFPDEIFVKRGARTDYDRLPDLFYAGSYWVVSGKAAEVMHRFNLGQGALYPTRVLKKDRKTPIGDEWFCLNFGNQKKRFRVGPCPRGSRWSRQVRRTVGSRRCCSRMMTSRSALPRSKGRISGSTNGYGVSSS